MADRRRADHLVVELLELIGRGVGVEVHPRRDVVVAGVAVGVEAEERAKVEFALEVDRETLDRLRVQVPTT